MKITSRQLRQIIREELGRPRQTSGKILEMHGSGGQDLISLYKQAAADVENSYAPDYDELAYKIDRLDQEFFDASKDGMTALSMLKSRHAREMFIRVAEALGYPQIDLDQDVLVPSNLVNAVIATIKAALPPEEDF